MRKIIVILLIAALLFAFPVSAAKNTDDLKGGIGVSAADASNKTAAGISDSLKGAGQSEQAGSGSLISQANKNESAGQGAGISAGVTSTYQNQQEIKAEIKLMQKEAANISGLESNNRLKNQNTVRVAVLTLLAAGNISGGIGDQISAIAMEFNNSIKAQYNSEEKIQNRNAVSRFFFGGDSDAAKDIQVQIEQNRLRIENLNTLMNQCDCDEELKTMIREQIQALEQDQNRLSELSQTELGDKGLLGGIFG